MPFSINEIKATLSDIGYQKSSHFACNIIPPASMNARGDFFLTRVNSMNLPGFNLGTDDIRYKGFGLSEKRPIQTSFEDVSLTIIADNRGEIHNTLHDWFELIHPTNDEEIGTEDIEYYNYPVEYYGGLEIYIYDIAGNQHTTYTFIQPFPIQLGSIQMSWDTQDSLLMIPVSFAFRSYRKNTSNKGFISNTPATNTQITQTIMV